MVRFRILGALVAFGIAALALGALWSLYGLFTTDYVTTAGTSLVVVLVVVGSGVLVGRRSDRWTDNPYW